MKLIAVSTFCVLTLLSLTACDPYANHGSSFRSNVAFSSDTNSRLAQATYDATDKLIALKEGQKRRISNTILVGTLSDVDYLETSTTLGRVLSEQIATYLVNNGYDVAELKMRSNLNIKRGLSNPSESGEYILSRDLGVLKTEYQAGHVVTGTYAVAGKEILVNLKMLDIKTGIIQSAVDYKIPLDANTRKLTRQPASGGFTFYGDSQAYD